MSARTTHAPSSTKRCAWAAPMPRAAPEMRATLPANRFVMVGFSLLSHVRRNPGGTIVEPTASHGASVLLSYRRGRYPLLALESVSWSDERFVVTLRYGSEAEEPPTGRTIVHGAHGDVLGDHVGIAEAPLEGGT